MLLILTSDQDLTADYLIVELVRRGLPYFRLNTEELAQATFNFALKGVQAKRGIALGPKALDLNAVAAVWYRRSIHPVPEGPFTPAERYFVAGELRHAALGLVLNPGAVWVNPIDKVSVAEHKLYQLQVAANIGFTVPRTLVSSDIEALHQFASENITGTICKPIFHGLFFDGASRHSIYTRRLDLATLDAASVSACPVLLQEEIPRVGDVRATFVGGRYFAAEIRGAESLVDWRDPGVVVDYRVSDLDEATMAMCQQMLTELGLVYGAFDFIRKPSGELVFLEINPTGEWAWLEEKLSLPIRDALIDLFYGSAP